MSTRPRLSLCIPTWNRARFLKDALESGLSEAASQPPGTVEVLVCDNASSDETQALITSFQAVHPELQAFRNDEQIGFDRNYLRCVEEARGEFVWVMGDDDAWLPGSVAHVLYELDAGADACLCQAKVCDWNLKPWDNPDYSKPPSPTSVCHIGSREDLIHYFNGCSYTGRVFAFISVGIFRRDRFLMNRGHLQQAIESQYVHLWGMMLFFRDYLKLHLIPEFLVLSRQSDSYADSYAVTNPYGRWMNDFRAWVHVADAAFGNDIELKESFSRIVKRNHGDDSFLHMFRQSARTEEDWLSAVPFLSRAGFSPIAIAAVDFGFRSGSTDSPTAKIYERSSHCLKILRFLAKEAKRIAIIALGGLPNILDEAALLATFRSKGTECGLKIFCTPECLEILDGFEVQCLDPNRYARDKIYRESMAKIMLDFAPELVLNLDPARSLEADDLSLAAHSISTIAFSLPDQGPDSGLTSAVNGAYTCLVPNEPGAVSLLTALGLEAVPAKLWPTQSAQKEAQDILSNLGWDPAMTLVLLVDHPSILEEPGFHSSLAEAALGRWTLLGLGSRIVSYQTIEALLNPWRDKSMNLTGVMGLGATAALLQRCGGFLGGTPLLRALAKACDCAPFRPKFLA